MVFSSATFLFLFLPIVLALYYLAPKFSRNLILLLASLFFYAWGEVFYLFILVFSILINYIFGFLICRYSNRLSLFLAIASNLLLLGIFKYTNFVIDNINTFLVLIGLEPIMVAPVHLPLGISFFTFQAISYLVDLSRGKVKLQKSLIKLALYIAMFPQLVSGPIVRYISVAQQISSRIHSSSLFASGVQRFIFGLAKKRLLANPLGEIADKIFILPAGDVPMGLAWLGIVAFTLQIYYDFSGYSDMAIGLGRMLGFRFMENFDYPYISKSIREFWRRWHISLSTWFRDYVYIPLGGNRVSTARIFFNLWLVFLLTGFWHGASWTYVAWGGYYGLFLCLERMGLNHVLEKNVLFSRTYTLLVIMVGWVIFRSESLSYAAEYLGSMVNFYRVTDSAYPWQVYMSNLSTIALLVGIFLATPVCRSLWNPEYYENIKVDNLSVKAHAANIVLMFLLLFLCMASVASSSYHPFLYFRF